MDIVVQRETLLKPLQTVGGVVERRQTLPVLANVLVVAGKEGLAITGTDLEVEMVAEVKTDQSDTGEFTLPARKFLDICRALPEGAVLNIAVAENRAVIKSGRSRFALATLPASEFPSIESMADEFTVELTESNLKTLIDQTQFSMAHQDVRYYLNGLLLELRQGTVRAVATDGHRLALCEQPCSSSSKDERQIIVPRKGVVELGKLLEASDEKVTLHIGTNHVQVRLPSVTFTSKLIDGRFPDYERVIPAKSPNTLSCTREAARQALVRASVLSNEKYRGVRLQLSKDLLRATVHNPEQEEAEEELEISYSGDELEIGFNVSYLLDALSAVKSESVAMQMADPNSSCLIQGEDEPHCKYVVMPMRL